MNYKSFFLEKQKLLSLFLIAILLIGEGIVFFIRCTYQEPISDEVLYEYVWETDDESGLWHEDHRLERKVESISQAFSSQIQHYKYASGRNLVHLIEQSFTGHRIAFAFFNTCIFLFLLFLIIKLCAPAGGKSNYILWFLTTSILVLFCPEPDEWTSINLAANYLWPTLISIIVILAWKKIEKKAPSAFSYPFIVLLGLAAGWTHEAFVAGLLGGVLLYYCIFRNKFHPRILWLFIPMSLTGAFLASSPMAIARFNSMEGVNSTILGKIATGIAMLSTVLFIWIILFIFIVAGIRAGKEKTKKFLQKNSKLICITIISFLITIVIHSGPRSVTPGFIFLLCLFFRLIFRWKGIYNKKLFWSGIPFLLLFLVQQAAVARDSIKNYLYQHEIIEKYKNSKDGIVIYDTPVFSVFTKPYIRLWNLKEFQLTPQLYQNWSKAYTQGKTTPLFIDSIEYLVFNNPDKFFIKKNRIPGEPEAYHSPNGQYYWLKPGTNLVTAEIEAQLKPISFDTEGSFFSRLIFLISPNSFPDKEKLKVDTVSSIYGDRIRITPPRKRKIENLKYIKF